MNQRKSQARKEKSAKRKKKKTYLVELFGRELYKASSPEEALKLVKKEIFTNGVTISVEDYGNGDGIEEDWDILQDLSRLFSGGRN